MSRSRGRRATLAAIAAVGSLGGSAAVLTVAWAVLRADRRGVVPVWQVLVAGGPMALVVAGVAGWAAGRMGRAVRLMRADAVHRLHDPTAPVSGAGRGVPDWMGTELVELGRTLDALHLRVRVADEVAERHRHAAETASAGMFELLSGLVEAEEGARGQLSAELHDTVAQSLMTARSMLADVPAAAQAADLVAEAEEQVRAVMARTRPPALRDGDLARAVAALRDDLHHRYGLEVQVEWPEEAYPLPLVTAVTVYRFFQEALLNVVKHADVDAACAALRVDEQWVRATVSDDGPGFDPDEVRPDRGRHVGLGLLRERARLVGGALELTSSPTTGTTLTLRLPRGAVGTAALLPVQRVTATV